MFYCFNHSVYIVEDFIIREAQFFVTHSKEEVCSLFVEKLLLRGIVVFAIYFNNQL